MEAAMQVSKWGNSLAVRLPKQLVDSLKLEEGDELIVVEAFEKKLVVARADRKADVIKTLEQFKFELPSDYKFDRSKANQR
jgi:antitoxin MazE